MSESPFAFEQFERLNGFKHGRYGLFVDANGRLQIEILIPGKRKPLRILQRSRLLQTLFALPSLALENLPTDRLVLRRLLEVASRLYSTHHFMMRVVEVGGKPSFALTPAVRMTEVATLLAEFEASIRPLIDTVVRFDESFRKLSSIEKSYLLVTSAISALHTDLSEVIDDQSDPFGLFVSGVDLSDLSGEILETITSHLVR